jgi:hypothetical protein
LADVGQPTQIRACPKPFDKLRTGLPKDEGEFISVGFAALHPPNVAGQMRIAGDGAEIYKVSYVRGQYEVL